MKQLLLETLAIGLPFFVWTLFLLRRKASKVQGSWSEVRDSAHGSAKARKGQVGPHRLEQPSGPEDELPPHRPADSE